MSKLIPKFFSRYAPPPSVGLDCKSASLTRQEYLKDADLNEIMRKYQDGVAPIPSGGRPPLFGDFSNVPDYQASVALIQDAESRFMALPAVVRDRFANDPARLLEFLADDSNREEAVKLGLISPPPPHGDGSQLPKSDVVNSNDSHNE